MVINISLKFTETWNLNKLFDLVFTVRLVRGKTFKMFVVEYFPCFKRQHSHISTHLQQKSREIAIALV